MILLIHIAIALTSVLFSTILLVSPSQTKFRTAYGLVGATLASGTYLVYTTHAPLVQSCTSGLFYLAVVSTILAAAHVRQKTID